MTTWPLPGVTGIDVPGPEHPGGFGSVRRHDIHTGIDLYCDQGQLVVALEKGRVISVCDFTGPDAGSPWWNPTQAVMVEGPSGVILYGEIDPLVSLGDDVLEGEEVGRVMTVLRHDKGLPMSMLHVELYVHGTDEPVWWISGARPACLLDPTQLLRSLHMKNLHVLDASK